MPLVYLLLASFLALSGLVSPGDDGGSSRSTGAGAMVERGDPGHRGWPERLPAERGPEFARAEIEEREYELEPLVGFGPGVEVEAWSARDGVSGPAAALRAGRRDGCVGVADRATVLRC